MKSGGHVIACCQEHAERAALYQGEELASDEPGDNADEECGDSCDVCDLLDQEPEEFVRASCLSAGQHDW
jgi:hypothetical protein